MEFIKDWLILAARILKWKISPLINLFGIKCGKCYWVDDGCCTYAGEISTNYWCIHFRRRK